MSEEKWTTLSEGHHRMGTLYCYRKCQYLSIQKMDNVQRQVSDGRNETKCWTLLCHHNTKGVRCCKLTETPSEESEPIIWLSCNLQTQMKVSHRHQSPLHRMLFVAVDIVHVPEPHVGGQLLQRRWVRRYQWLTSKERTFNSIFTLAVLQELYLHRSRNYRQDDIHGTN